MNRLAVLRWALLAGFSLSMVSTGAADEGWRTVSVSFRPINIANSQNALWICGVHEGIASSKDGGSSWQVHQSSEGGILLNIGFVDAKVGYAGGTNGLLLLTKAVRLGYQQKPEQNPSCRSPLEMKSTA